MNYDVKLTPATILALASWVTPDMADVELAVDDRMLVAQQGDERMAWDTDGSPASAEYLAVAPLDPTGSDRLQIIHVIRPGDMSEDVAAFVREEDAEAYRDTFDARNVGDVERVTICGPELAAEMIASRADEPYCAWCSDGEDRAPYCGGPGCKP